MTDNQVIKQHTILNTNVLIIMKNPHPYRGLSNWKSIIYNKKVALK